MLSQTLVLRYPRRAHGAWTPASPDALAQALLEDMMPAPSGKCTVPAKGASSTFTFSGWDNRSTWDSTTKAFESQAFLAQMNHDDANANHTWQLRLAKGGNAYSFLGAFGEAMPPQYHVDAPWIDEVWQMVAVDNTKNTASNPYFIHQAGTYQREASLKTKPFYSPPVATHCTKGECTFANWGQHAHVPTNFESALLYYTRFRNCGDGHMEVTYMMHNFAVSGGASMNYLNVPWAGVRKSSLKSIAMPPSVGAVPVEKTLGQWGAAGDKYIPNLNTFGGYTAFAQDLPKNVTFTDMPTSGGAALTLQVAKTNACAESKSHTTAWKVTTFRIKVKANFKTNDGCRSCALQLSNGRGGHIDINGILHWGNNAVWTYFWPTATVTVSQVNSVFKNGDMITVTKIPSALSLDSNLGLGFVHGNEGAGTYEGDSNWQSKERTRGCRVRFGSTSSATRDYSVYTVNAFPKLRPGTSYFFRQYLVAGRHVEMPSRAGPWVGEVRQGFLTDHSEHAAHAGRSVGLYAAGNGAFDVVVDPEPNAVSTRVPARTH